MRVSCLAIDVTNPDKPAASLAFMCGVCEHLDLDYQALSINTEMLLHTHREDYNRVHNALKLNDFDRLQQLSDPIANIILKQIQDYGPDIIMVSLFSWMQFPLAKIILDKIRSSGCSAEIIAGGPGIQSEDTAKVTNGKKLAQKNLIDYYVLGEGDEVLVRFLQGERTLLGLNSRTDRFGESWVPQIDDLDRHYVKPSYKKINLDVYHNLEYKEKAVLSVSTSRGCVRACSFCDVINVWPKFRYRSGKLVAEEILQLHKETGAVNFTIVDSLINGSLKSFRDFNDEVVCIKEKTPSLEKMSYNGLFIVRPRNTHKEDLFKTMAAAGCESLAIGVETGSDNLRMQMAKKFTNDDLDYHLEMCQKYGIRNTMLLFVGYPTETRDDFEQTLRMLERYQHYLIDNTIISLNFSGVFSMYTNTPIYNDAAHLGIEIVETDSQQMKMLNWVNVNNPDLTVRERIMRDLTFRQRAAELRYPIPNSARYLEYLQHIDKNFIPVSD